MPEAGSAVTISLVQGFLPSFTMPVAASALMLAFPYLRCGAAFLEVWPVRLDRLRLRNSDC